MARVMTRTSLSCSSALAGAFPLPVFFDSSSFDFFFSCLARSSAFVSLVNATVFPSGAQLGFAAPFGRSVKTNESPPAIGRISNPYEIEQILLSDVALLPKYAADACNENEKNDERRMSNDEGMTKPEARNI